MAVIQGKVINLFTHVERKIEVRLGLVVEKIVAGGAPGRTQASDTGEKKHDAAHEMKKHG